MVAGKEESINSVQFLKTDPKARYQGYSFYFREHQLFVLEALSQSSKKLDPKFEALQQLISKQQKPIEFKNYSLFASVQLAERMLLLLVCGLVMVSCWFFGMGANKLQTASDYDLRYRYLRMQGKATASDFAHLDSIFVTHRNPKAILQLEQKVVDYEQSQQRQAKYYSR